MQTCHTNTKLEKNLLGFNYLAIFFSFLFHVIARRATPDVAISYTNVYNSIFFVLRGKFWLIELFLSVGVCNFVEITN